MKKIEKACGTWRSSISPEMVAEKGIRYGHMQVFEGKVYWLESRPELSGKNSLVCYNGQTLDEIPMQNLNARSRVHEYGGGDFLVSERGIFFSNDLDQAIYLLDRQNEIRPITKPSRDRYADFSITPDGNILFAVREAHGDAGIINDIIAIHLNEQDLSVKVIASGHDFYSYPRVSPDGTRVLWTCWNQPQMPWDGSELWVADLTLSGEVQAQHKIAGGDQESIYQPAWSPDSVIHFISDRSGWWNLYSFRSGVLNALTPTANDFGLPQWVFGSTTYCFGTDDNIYISYFEQGQQHLAHLNTKLGHVEPFALPFHEYPGQLHFSQECLYVIAGGPLIPLGIYKITLANGEYELLNGGRKLPVAQDAISLPRAIEYNSIAGHVSHGYFYQPVNPEYCPIPGELPPLIVISHSGPTSSTSTTLNWVIQFWTSRGYAVVDVNYAGSTGYGREYRRLLNQRWGINDVQDCVSAARFLVEAGLVDEKRLLIRGGSAGGFTTLCALTFFDDFAAGMIRYAVADLESLVNSEHKFEARYLDNLIGSYPQEKDRYYQLSPINFVEQVSCPLLILQGSEDKVVPPQQARQLVSVLQANDIPHTYIEFQGEGHGFRSQVNILHALEAEVKFYSDVLKLNDSNL